MDKKIETQSELNAALASRPSPDRIGPDHVESVITDELYIETDASTLTICILTLQNGYTVTGQSACADPANYDQAIGRKIARDNAVREIYPLEGYLLKQRLWFEGLADA